MTSFNQQMLILGLSLMKDCMCLAVKGSNSIACNRKGAVSSDIGWSSVDSREADGSEVSV